MRFTLTSAKSLNSKPYLCACLALCFFCCHLGFHLPPCGQDHLLPPPLQQRLPLIFILTPSLPLILLNRLILHRLYWFFSMTLFVCQFSFQVISRY